MTNFLVRYYEISEVIFLGLIETSFITIKYVYKYI